MHKLLLTVFAFNTILLAYTAVDFSAYKYLENYTIWAAKNLNADVQWRKRQLAECQKHFVAM